MLCRKLPLAPLAANQERAGCISSPRRCGTCWTTSQPSFRDYPRLQVIPKISLPSSSSQATLAVRGPNIKVTPLPFNCSVIYSFEKHKKGLGEWMLSPAVSHLETPTKHGGARPAKVRSWESNPGLPGGWQEPNFCKSSACIPRSLSARS